MWKQIIIAALFLTGCERAHQYKPVKILSYQVQRDCKRIQKDGYLDKIVCKVTNSVGQSICEVDWHMTVPCEFYDGIQ
jgi:hypothetical protein